MIIIQANKRDRITKEKIDYHSFLDNKKKLISSNNKDKNSLYFILISFSFLLSTFLAIPAINIVWADSVIATVSVGNEPRFIAHNPDNGNMYVANTGFDSTTVSVVDSDNQVTSVPVGNAPQHIVYNENNKNMYVANTFSNTVSVIDPTNNQVIATVPVGFSPRHIAYNEVNKNMYVVNFGSGTVSVINSNNQIIQPPILVGPSPQTIAYNPDNGNVYVTSFGSNTVSVINSNNQRISTVFLGPLGLSPFYIAHNPDNGNMYVTNLGSNTVSVIQSTNNIYHVIATVPVGSSPQYIAHNPDNGNMYVANSGSGTVSVIDPTNNQVIATVPVGSSPQYIAHNPDNGNMYVTNLGSNTVSVIDPTNNQVIENIPAGSTPFYITHNPDNGNMYVTNFLSDTISIIQTTSITDDIPPVTSITTVTDGNNNLLNSGDPTTSNSITFVFTGQDDVTIEENLAFECSLDSATFEQCTSPLNINSLTAGEHTFAVRSIDEAGNVDQTPEEFTWIVDNIPPETEITSVKDGQGTELFNGDTTISSQISISFTGSDALTLQENLAFECSLDSATFEQCTSPLNINSLTAGEHTFAVSSIDEAGNVDQTPEEFTWTIFTLSEGVTEIETIIEDLNLPQGVENSLKAQLSQATKLLNDNNPTNDDAVCDKLDSFILEVNKKFFNGQLSSEYATLLIAKANAIANELGC